jgi:hypothetical protein
MGDIANTQNYKMVMRFNAFTHKLDDCYLMSKSGLKGKLFNPRDGFLYLSQNPSMPCEVLEV